SLSSKTQAARAASEIRTAAAAGHTDGFADVAAFESAVGIGVSFTAAELRSVVALEVERLAGPLALDEHKWNAKAALLSALRETALAFADPRDLIAEVDRVLEARVGPKTAPVVRAAGPTAAKVRT